MKKNILRTFFFAVAASAAFVSCSFDDLKSLWESSGISTPQLNFKNVSINSLDTEGVSFKCNYDVSNPYNVNLSLAKISADIKCDGKEFTSLNADEGISLTANSIKTNSFNFKVPYDSLLNFAKTYQASDKTLPFNINGNIGLDVSSVLPQKELNLPFNKDFDAPVVKPSFSVSSPTITLPSLSEITNELTKKINPVDAAIAAGKLIAGQGIDASLLDNVDLNMKLNFDLDVSNKGGSAWKYLLKNCSIDTGNENEEMIGLDTSSVQEITSSSGTVPLTANLNTLKFGKFVAKLINKSGTNPSFKIDSGVSFPEITSALEIPLSYKTEIPLDKITTK